MKSALEGLTTGTYGYFVQLSPSFMDDMTLANLIWGMSLKQY